MMWWNCIVETENSKGGYFNELFFCIVILMGDNIKSL